MKKIYFIWLVIFISIGVSLADEEEDEKAKAKERAEKWKKKDVRDYSDADIERLFDQWEVSSRACERNGGFIPRRTSGVIEVQRACLTSAVCSSGKLCQIFFYCCTRNAEWN